MPVIIQELLVRATVNSGGEKSKSLEGIKPLDRKELIEACVEAVLDILENKRER